MICSVFSFASCPVRIFLWLWDPLIASQGGDRSPTGLHECLQLLVSPSKHLHPSGHTCNPTLAERASALTAVSFQGVICTIASYSPHPRNQGTLQLVSSRQQQHKGSEAKCIFDLHYLWQVTFYSLC